MPVVQGVGFEREFDDPGPHADALTQFQAIDRPLDAQDPATWGLAAHQTRLSVGLLAKLGRTPGATVQVLGLKGRMPTGGTTLTGYVGPLAAPTALVNLTSLAEADVRKWLKDKRGAAFLIKVEVFTSTSTGYAGTVMEILNHELSAHAEPFSDFISAVTADSAAGLWESEDDQHKRLKSGDARYQLIAARYLTDYPKEGQADRFKIRRTQDFRAYPALPPGF